MPKKTPNLNLRMAAAAKKAEFYTQLPDIEMELSHYKAHFKGKVVFCNCDDPRVSNFFHYFAYNFKQLGLKKLITTCYKSDNADLFSQNNSEKAIYLEYTGEKKGGKVPTIEQIGIQHLKEDGDFRSQECIELLKQADIVVTNPPFYLFREYLAQLVKHEKQFLIIGNTNAIAFKEIFPLIKNNKLWLGCTNFNVGMFFEVPDNWEHFHHIDQKTGKKIARVSAACWFTNLDYQERYEDLVLYKSYSPDEYPKFDHYDAINVNKTKDIPRDYPGRMGVPLTFLDKFNPEQFEIVDGLNRYSILEGPTEKTRGKYLAQVKGNPTYIRIVIKNKKLCKSNSKK